MKQLALVGLGLWGNNFIETAAKIKNCRIKYIVATKLSTLSKFPSNYIKTTNYSDLLRYSDIDGIIIATPGSTHFPIVEALIKKKVPLFVEKPLTINYKETLLLQKLAKKIKTPLMVGHIYLYNPAFKTAKQVLPQIGKIRYMSFKGYNYGPFRSDMSALWEWAPHGVAMSIDLLQEMPQSVNAWAINTLRPKEKLYDNFSICLHFKKNRTVVLECGWLYPLKRREMMILGTKGSIIFDDLASSKITLLDHLGPIVKQNRILEETPTSIYPSYSSKTALEMELKEFLDVIEINKLPLTDIDHAVDVARIIDAAQRSIADDGKIIHI